MPPRDHERLLARYRRSDGTIDYATWHDSDVDVDAWEQLLDELAAAPAAHGVEALAYWINLYNAWVIAEILRRWPLQSVRDVRAGLLLGSKGFFRGLRLRVGDRELSLDDIEHRIIREQFRDARIHFALNCGARSCPPPRLLGDTAAAIEESLERAAREFLSDQKNVAVDHARRTIRLSRLFKWYEDDFVSHAREMGVVDPTVVDFICLWAPDAVVSELRKGAGYRLRYHSYDWKVNAAESV